MSSLSDAAPKGATAPTRASFTDDVHVLIVEDDDADAFLITSAISDNPRVTSIAHAVDGVEALELLVSGFEPDLAIIDLNMPRKNGFDFLLDLQCSEWTFRKVVLTSSRVGADAVRSKLRGASKVLVKPDSIGDLEKLLGAEINAA